MSSRSRLAVGRVRAARRRGPRPRSARASAGCRRPAARCPRGSARGRCPRCAGRSWPPCWRANARLNSDMYAVPTCGSPVGEGATRRRGGGGGDFAHGGPDSRSRAAGAVCREAGLARHTPAWPGVSCAGSCGHSLSDARRGSRARRCPRSRPRPAGRPRPGPTPAGVPVRMTSPGSRVNALDACETRAATSWTMSAVEPSCTTSPSRRGHQARARWGRGRSRSTGRAGRTCRSPWPAPTGRRRAAGRAP